MRRKIRNRRSVYHSEERKFEKRFAFRWALPLILSLVIIILSLTICNNALKETFIRAINCFGNNEEYIFDNMRKEASFLGNAVWTLTTILAAFMVFHYSSQANCVYGVPTRKIIAYTLGTYFIPGLVFYNIIVVLGMTCSYYLKSFSAFYILSIYSIFLQILLILCSIKSTSQRKSFKIILRIEKKQFNQLCEKTKVNEGEFFVPSSRKNLLIYHIDSILKGKETFTEKFEVIQEILYIPFYSNYLNNISYTHCIYYYLYKNLNLISLYISNQVEECQKFYNIVYENVYDFWKQYTCLEHCYDSKTKKEVSGKILLYMAALFHAVIPNDKILERWEFLSFLIVGIFNDIEFRKVVLIELLMSLYDLWRLKLIDFGKDNETEKIVDFLKILLKEKTQHPVRWLFKDLDRIKNELQMIVLSWNVETTINPTLRYKKTLDILECLEKNDADNFIPDLLSYVEVSYK